MPLYLLGERRRATCSNVYSEPEVGIERPTSTTSWSASQRAATAISPPVSRFLAARSGHRRCSSAWTASARPIGSPSAGTLAFLPGIPPRSVTDRQGYVQARVDYLNHLFSSNAYLVARRRQSGAREAPAADPARHRAACRRDGAQDPPRSSRRSSRASPYPPLEVHNLEHEIGKVGTDMFIALALANMRIYLVGGLRSR